MTTSRKRWIGWLVLFALIALGWAGCNALRVDHRNAIVQALLFRPGGDIDDHVLTGALNARFPTGTQATALGDFVETMGGSCSRLDTGEFSCLFDESGTFCVATKIDVKVRVDAHNAIESMAAKSYTIGC
jgi:hypothetical protein